MRYNVTLILAYGTQQPYLLAKAAGPLEAAKVMISSLELANQPAQGFTLLVETVED
jgi:hypothetical protein